MRKKVQPLNTSTHNPISSTSRHELKDFKSSLSEGIEGPVNLSNLKLKFLISQLAKKIKYLAPPLVKPEYILEDW